MSATVGHTHDGTVGGGGPLLPPALTGMSSDGIAVRTSAITFTPRTITGTSGTITVTNGNGVSGNPTLTIDAAYIGQNTITTLGTITTGVWTGTAVAVVNGGTGSTSASAARTALGLVIGTNVQAYSTQLATLTSYNSNGLLTQTSAGNYTGRTITGTADTITITNGDGVSGNPTATIANTYAGQTSITTLGTIGTGTWNGNLVLGQYGGTGVANTGKTITLGGNLVTSGAFNTTLTVTADTNVTLPTSGTLVNTAVTSLGSLTSAASLATVGTITSGTWSGTAIAVNKGGTGLTTLTANNVILGNGTSAPSFVAPSTSGNVLTSNGTTWVSSATTSTVAFSQIAGYLPSSIAGNATTGSLTVATGQAADSTNTTYITKGTTTSWAVSNGNAANGYQGGTTLPNSSTIHFYIIQTSAGASQSTFASTSLTPTLPASHSGGTYRRIFSLQTTGAGALIPGSAVESFGGSLMFYLTTQVLDINGATPATANRTLYTLSIPSGLKLQPLFRMNPDSSQIGTVIITSPDEVDVAPQAGFGTSLLGNYYSAFTAAPGYDGGGNDATGGTVTNDGVYNTNTSGQIGIRATGASSVYWVTRGWIDFRR